MNMFPEYIKYNIFDDNILNDIDEINKDFKITENKNKPFKYIILDDFLKPEVHNQIKNEVINIPIDVNNLYKGKLEAPVDGPMFIGYSGDWHDAYRLFPRSKFNMKMNLFMRGDVCQFIQSFWPDISFTNELLLDLHHHQEFSRDGFVHNDFDPSIFYGDDLYYGTDLSYEWAGPEACDSPEPNMRYVQKSLAWVYYIGYGNKLNDYKPSGGHTALFDNDMETPVFGVEPIENRFLMFEISPESFHASRTNNSTYRDALFGWLHSEMSDVSNRFPNSDLCANVRGTGFIPSEDKSIGKSIG